MPQIEWLSVLTAAISSFALGSLWYAPFAFGTLQERALNAHGETVPRATPRILISTFLLTVVEAAAFAWVFHDNVSFQHALGTGVLVGGGFVAAGSAINYAYTGRGAKLCLIDGGFHIARFVVYALVLWAWR
jgi:hypothetical protein